MAYEVDLWQGDGTVPHHTTSVGIATETDRQKPSIDHFTLLRSSISPPSLLEE